MQAECAYCGKRWTLGAFLSGMIGGDHPNAECCILDCGCGKDLSPEGRDLAEKKQDARRAKEAKSDG